MACTSAPSTSEPTAAGRRLKLQALLWTYAILFALIALFAADQLGLEFIVGANPAGENELGGFADLPFPEEYLLFLGGPFAAAVVAKASTTGKVQQGTVVKPPVTADDDGQQTGSGLSDGLKEVISNDAGRTDLLDLQYFLFNLLALGVFLATFVFNLNEGLPDIPLFLVALTGTSALTYATKKSIESATPTIDSVVPANAYPGDTLTVEGQNLLAPRAIAPRVMIDGREVPADGVVVERGTAADAVATIEMVVPSDAESGPEKKLVLTPLGATASASSKITIRGAEIESVQPSSMSLLPGAAILISGRHLGPECPGGATLRLGTLALGIESWTDSLIAARLPATISPDEIALQGTTADLQLVIPGRGRTSKAVSLAPLASSVTSVAPSPLILEPGSQLTVVGKGFGRLSGNVTLDSLGPLKINQWTDSLIVAKLPSAFALPDGKYASDTAVAVNISPGQNRPAATSSLNVRAP